jgi:hypothetical protein
MKTMLKMVALSLVATGLAACASTDDRSARATPQMAPIDVDQAYIARVEEIARRRGLEVQWVNPPTTRQDLVASGD